MICSSAVIKYFDLLFDRRNKKAWGLLSIVLLTGMMFSCASVQEQYQSVQKEGSIAAYEEFVSDNPDGPYTALAKKELEKLRFEHAIASENEKELESLLENPLDPKISYVKQARETLAKIKAGYLMKNQSLHGYQNFFSKFKNTDAAKQLEDAFDSFYGKTVMMLDTLKDYTGYISRFPNGKFAAQTQKRGEQLWWIEKSDHADIKDYEQYMDLFPGGVHEPEVKEILEKMMWSDAEETAIDSDLYLSYLERFPEGAHHSQARDCVDWSMAEKKGPKGIQSYLDVHPDGRFSEHGRKIIHSASQVTDDKKEIIQEKVWDQVKSALGQGSRMRGTVLINGWISSGKTYLSYNGIVSEQGKARVLLNNHSKFEMSGIVYEYFDGDWFPVYDRIFKTKKGK